jgi:hypothetical protein
VTAIPVGRNAGKDVVELSVVGDDLGRVQIAGSGVASGLIRKEMEEYAVIATRCTRLFGQLEGVS